MLFFVPDIYSDSKAVYASRPANSKSGCRVHFRDEAVKFDSGDHYGDRVTASPADSRSIRFFALKATGSGWCDEDQRSRGGAAHGEAPRALR